MGRKVFHFNRTTHRYEVYRPGPGQWMLRCGIPLLLTVLLSLGIRYSLGRYIGNPKEIKLLAEKEALIDRYSGIKEKVGDIEATLGKMQNWDDNIYRAFYELDPISASIREAGLGGTDRYSNLQGYESTELMTGLTRRIDMTGVKLDIQERSLADLAQEAEDHWLLMKHRPSIQPISLENFYWISSVYGYRTDPMSKKRTMHRGVDFAGRLGLKVYATGDGTVIRTKISKNGFGKEVLIDHGFGYVTRYGHLQNILVHTGQQVSRGTVVGTVGSTGKSTGPHLHYEVRYYGVAKNPKHYFSEDLSAAEYRQVVSLAGSVEN